MTTLTIEEMNKVQAEIAYDIDKQLQAESILYRSFYPYDYYSCANCGHLFNESVLLSQVHREILWCGPCREALLEFLKKRKQVFNV